ncbi:MAG: NAD(P)H-dependent oxidoreductase [Clostridia bacterium]
MKIAVLNGSPKGDNSITLQSILYLQKLNKAHDFDIINVGQLIKPIGKDPTEAIEKVKKADIIIFSYPVYTCLVPSQLHRFLEILQENKVELKGKFATQITTSKHFYDFTAHQFIEDFCLDAGLKYVKGLSADMEDLLNKEGQKDCTEFFDYFMFCVKNDIYKLPMVTSLSKHKEYSKQVEMCAKSSKYDIVVLTDCKVNDKSLQDMIADFENTIGNTIRIVNVTEFPFKGGCLGCLKCASSGKCVYNDGFDEFLRNKVQCADAIVYAFSVSNHMFSSYLKRYDDRQFCNGHRSVTAGMPIAYLINGEYNYEHNLRNVVEGRAEIGNNFLAGVATNLAEIKAMCATLLYALDRKLVLPQNFLGVGGSKIFRDLVYVMRGLMKADHKYYKQKGIYDDLPNKQKKKMLAMCLVGKLVENKKIKKKMGNIMVTGVLMPYKKILKNLDKEN